MIRSTVSPSSYHLVTWYWTVYSGSCNIETSHVGLELFRLDFLKSINFLVCLYAEIFTETEICQILAFWFIKI